MNIRNEYDALKEFNEKYGGESYSEGFFLTADEDDFWDSWLGDELPKEKKKDFSKSVKIFAGADGTGGHYAFWFNDKNYDENTAPVVFFGSEGEVNLIASSIRDLIKILSLGVEISNGSFSRSCWDEYDDSEEICFDAFLERYPNFLTFRKWMKDTLEIEPVEWRKEGENKKINVVMASAKEKYQHTSLLLT